MNSFKINYTTAFIFGHSRIRTMEVRNGCYKIYHRVLESHPGALESHPGAMEAFPRAKYTNSGAAESYSGAMETCPVACKVH
jgi:hypothetical protein